MSKLEKYLHYYGILFSIFILFYSLFFLPNPQKLWLLLTSLPLIIYFSLKRTAVSEEKKETASLWLWLTLIVIFIQITSASFWGFFYFQETKKTKQIKNQTLKQAETTKESPSTEENNKKILEDLNLIKDELNKIKAKQEELTFVLGASAAGQLETDIFSSLNDLTNQLSENILKNSTAAGNKTSNWLLVSSKEKMVPIYQNKSSTAKVVGYTKNGEVLYSTKKEGEWYLVKNEQIEGWLKSIYVKEVN